MHILSWATGQATGGDRVGLGCVFWHRWIHSPLSFRWIATGNIKGNGSGDGQPISQTPSISSVSPPAGNSPPIVQQHGVATPLKVEAWQAALAAHLDRAWVEALLQGAHPAWVQDWAPPSSGNQVNAKEPALCTSTPGLHWCIFTTTGSGGIHAGPISPQVLSGGDPEKLGRHTQEYTWQISSYSGPL